MNGKINNAVLELIPSCYAVIEETLQLHTNQLS